MKKISSVAVKVIIRNILFPQRKGNSADLYREITSPQSQLSKTKTGKKKKFPTLHGLSVFLCKINQLLAWSVLDGLGCMCAWVCVCVCACMHVCGHVCLISSKDFADKDLAIVNVYSQSRRRTQTFKWCFKSLQVNRQLVWTFKRQFADF